MHAPLCLQKHYLQQPRHGNNLNVHQQRMDEDVVYAHNGILLSHKNEIMPFVAASVNKYHIISLIYGI